LGDIIRFQDKFYVLASSPLADDRTRVLKYGETSGVFNRYGDIETVGQGQLGIFYVESRHLSRMTLRFDGQTPLLLASTPRDDNAFLSVDLTNFDTGTRPDIPRGTVHLYRSKFLDEGICYEQFRLTNYGLTPVEFSLSFECGADFADIFEVRGTERH
jgi:glycogen debranching enzyme